MYGERWARERRAETSPREEKKAFRIFPGGKIILNIYTSMYMYIFVFICLPFFTSCTRKLLALYFLKYLPKPLNVGVRHGLQNVIPSGRPLDLFIFLKQKYKVV